MPSTETINELRHELDRKRAEAKALEQAIALLSGSDTVVIYDSGPVQQDFKGLGIVDAATRYLREVGEPKSTKDIADELLKRGLETNAKKWTATVYATLDNSKQFHRIGQGRKGRWEPRRG